MPKIYHFKQNQTRNYTDTIKTFVELGYHRVPTVLTIGEFSVKGSVIDIFPANHTHALRLEFQDDLIERISTIDCHTQRTLRSLHETTVSENQDEHTPFATITPVPHDVLSQFSNGDYIVHEEFGIGQFAGLQHLTLSNHQEGEFIVIRFKGKDRLFLPLDKLQFIHPYQDKTLSPPPELNALHDGKWQKTKQKVSALTQELAEDIYILYKTRQSKSGFKFSEDTTLQLEFEAAFEHTETEGQRQAIQEIKEDMESPHPMDRLLCGDVGFGKTEVILRSTFKAIQDKKQVAVLVPTTILADQHLRNFSNRLAPFGVTVQNLSRFVAKKDQKSILSGLKTGTVDVVIGTHRLLSRDIQFNDLGLLVIDEEQRFGVTHKEKLKQLKTEVDVLSVSATPIPRTLYMSLTGAREISKIETPPTSRKPILTKVLPLSEPDIVTAVDTEMNRNGQVYYLYNNVASFPEKRHQLCQLFPRLTIETVHGQMNQHELKEKMTQFWNQEIDILICSTIIENGLDSQNVNTIIIDGVENLGLSQLHQIRGRVGRSDQQAYAYFFYAKTRLTEKMQKRLTAIREYVALGAGYHLARKDLEIRGAGSLLGHRQSGAMTSVGFDLYCQLLDTAVKKSKGLATPPKKSTLFEQPGAFFPASYIPAERERLALYQKLLSLHSETELDAIENEIRDRYGLLPHPVEDWFHSIRQTL